MKLSSQTANQIRKSYRKTPDGQQGPPMDSGMVNQVKRALEAGAPRVASVLASAGLLLEWATITTESVIRETKTNLENKVTPYPGEAEQLALMALIPSGEEQEAIWLSQNAIEDETAVGDKDLIRAHEQPMIVKEFTQPPMQAHKHPINLAAAERLRMIGQTPMPTIILPILHLARLELVPEGAEDGEAGLLLLAQSEVERQQVTQTLAGAISLENMLELPIEDLANWILVELRSRTNDF